MAAEDHLGVQFHYYRPGEDNPHSLYTTEGLHTITARMPVPFAVGQPNRVTPAGTTHTVGEMQWKQKGGKIMRIDVPHIFQRQGVATGMYEEGKRLAAEHQRIPRPAHSADRTTEGQAWAKAVGGRLPRRLADV